jgi:hypothetical protein
MAAINAAITATLGVAVLMGLDPELSGAIGLALAAWIFVGALLFVRSKVASPLTQENLQKELAEAQAKGV